MIHKDNSFVSINLSQLDQNISQLSQHLGEDTRIMAVVKANAYGHGALGVAEHIEDSVGAFAVNDIEEGIELREHGINKPILVFAVPEKSSIDQYRIHNLTATISAFEHFEWLPSGTSFHLNFDTGMGRLGFAPEDAGQIAEMVSDHATLFCTGLYSHFATADNPNSDQVQEQQKLFKKIQSHFPEKLNAHIANTGATAYYDTEQFNMVRLGIGLYGYSPGYEPVTGIAPVLKWKSRLVQVKKLHKGDTISYGATWRAPGEGYLGIIPVGYDDGLRRRLSGDISVQINGKIYGMVGTITMNYCMVFLEKDNYDPGTEVELLHGEQNAADWAKLLHTIPYEILCSINPQIERKYI